VFKVKTLSMFVMQDVIGRVHHSSRIVFF